MWDAALRALVLGVVLAAIAPAVVRVLVARPWYWLAVALPALTPSVMIGHGYVGWSPGAAGSFGLESGYAILVAGKLLPIAAILQFVLPPPPLSARGRHGLELAGVRRLRDLPFGPLRNAVVVAGIVFVLAFQEFELASLFYGVRSWTVAVFDAQAGGLVLAATLRQAIGPVAVEFGVLAIVVGVFLATRVPGEPPAAEAPAPEPPAPEPSVAGAPGRIFGCISGRIWILSAALVITVVPGVLLMPAVTEMDGQLHMLGDIRHSIVLAGGAVICAAVVAAKVPGRVLAGLCVPGLAGGLVLALAVQALFQTPLLAVAYDSPVPLLLAWTLLLLPMAAVLRLTRDRITAHRALHVARLLIGAPDGGQRRAGRSLEFRLRGLFTGLAGALLFVVAFFEVVAGDLLAPGGMSPAAPRLYNLMHYGRSPGLAAMVLLMAVSGIACVATGLLLWKFVARSSAVSSWLASR